MPSLHLRRYGLHSIVRTNSFSLFQIGFMHPHISTWRVKMDVTQSKHLQPWLGSSYQSVTDETTFWGENVIWDQCTCLLLAVNIIVLSRESRSSLLRIGDRVSFCARSWSWSKETYLSGKMSVISFSNQFSGCFSHNSGDFLAAARTEDPFIPCLYLSPLYHTK